MSFHAGQTFTFGEQPSATKWQYVWDNDYALADGSGISDNVIGSRQIQLANNTGLNALTSGAVEKELLRLDNDDYLRLSQLPGQRNTTNTVDEGVLIQYGWGIIAYNTGAAAISEFVNFPTTFSEVPMVLISLNGDATTGTADAIGNGGNTVEGRLCIKSIGQTASGFQAFIHTAGGTNFAAGEGYYSWIAIGKKS